MCGCGLWICECMRAAHVCIRVSHDIGSDISSTEHLVMREFVSGPPGHHSWTLSWLGGWWMMYRLGCVSHDLDSTTLSWISFWCQKNYHWANQITQHSTHTEKHTRMYKYTQNHTHAHKYTNAHTSTRITLGSVIVCGLCVWVSVCVCS